MLSYQNKRVQSTLAVNHNWREDSFMHTFLKSIRAVKY